MKEPWNITQEEVEACLAATTWSPAIALFSWRRFSSTS